MLLHHLHEMTIRFCKVNQDVINYVLDQVIGGEEVGKVDGYIIHQLDLGDDFKFLGLMKIDKPVAFIYFKDKLNEVELYLISSKEVRQGHASRLLWFIKNDLGKRILDHRAISDDGLKFIT